MSADKRNARTLDTGTSVVVRPYGAHCDAALSLCTFATLTEHLFSLGNAKTSRRQGFSDTILQQLRIQLKAEIAEF